jgi:hypothetical protein
MTIDKSLIAAAFAAAVVAGCSGEPTTMTTKKLNEVVQGNSSEDDRAKIKAALEKNGVKGEIELIEDSGKSWTVEMGAPPGPEGKGGKKTGGLMFRPAYTVDKTSLKVTKVGKRQGSID